MPRLTCRHCRRSKPCRPRGLCHVCYYTPGVRELYPTVCSPCSRRGVLDFYGTPPRPGSPTNAAPGSEEKVAVLAKRAAHGEALHHPDDLTAAQVTIEAWLVPLCHAIIEEPHQPTNWINPDFGAKGAT